MRPGLLKSAFTFSSLTLVSRVLGLVRDIVIAAVFGPGTAADAFLVAFKIPNFMRRLFAEGAFSQSFVPVLSEYKTRRTDADVRLLVSQTLGALLSVLLAVVLIGVLAAPWVIDVFAPGFSADPEKYRLTVTMLRWTFPYLLLISLVACGAGVLNTYGSFGPPAFAPVLLNLALIGAALWAAPHLHTPILALAFAVVGAGVLQVLLLIPFLAKRRMVAMPRWGWREPGVTRILKLMGPAIFGSSVAQVNLLVDTVLASFLITGSVSWLYFSDRLVEFPVGVFGVAFGTIILPKLSGHFAEAASDHYSQTLDWALRWVVLIALPSTVGLVVFAGPLIATLFNHGAFDVQDVYATALSLMAFSLGLSGFLLVKVLAPGYFARQDTRTPVRYAVASMLCNMAISSTSVLLLRHTPVGHVGVAFGTACAQLLNATLLYRGLRGRGIFTPQPGWQRLFRQAGSATLVMGGVILFPAMRLDVWFARSLASRAGFLLLWVTLAMAVYLVCLRLFGLRWSHLREPATS